MITIFKAHKRAITFTFLAWVVFCVFFLIPNRSEGPFYFVFFSAVFVVLIASQIFWIRCVVELGKRLIPGKRWRQGLGAAGLLVYFFLLAFRLFYTGGNDSFVLTLRSAVLAWWLVGSVFGLLIAILLGGVGRLADAINWAFKKFITPPTPDLRSPERRRFLKETAIALSAAPFVAGAYGLFYGRLNLETTHQQIKLRRLPKTFDGFRIVQLSDLHISSFMSAEEIRKYVAIANQLKGDLVVLTGDFVTDDPSAEGAVVRELSALHAPFGVFGCLGNHEYMTETEESITRLFASGQIRILRQERVPIQLHEETLNLIGIDYQQARFSKDHGGHLVDQYLAGSENLVMPGTVNILLNHNPNAFDRAAELGIDLMLAGHTHGGQLSLEFVHRGLCLSRLVTPYVSGWYQKAGSQLYVNRGIGTIGLPMRVGARPEITVFELVREI